MEQHHLQKLFFCPAPEIHLACLHGGMPATTRWIKIEQDESIAEAMQSK